MKAEPPAPRLDELYDGLARYCWLLRRLRLLRPGQGLVMHKSLAAPAPGQDGPGAGTSAIHGWLLAKANGAPEGPLLDVGCGLGGTLIDLVRLSGRFGTGLTASPFQAARAAEQVQRLGLADTCELRVQSYEDAISGSFALVVAIEALFHATRLAEAMRNIAKATLPSGHLVLCEDMLVDAAAAADPRAQALGTAWSTPELHSVADYRSALATAGFELVSEHDLTAQVRPAIDSMLDAREARLVRLLRLLPWRRARAVVFAYRGGIALERLYAAGLMSYRTLVAVRAGGSR